MSPLLIEILARCFCGLRIPGAKEKYNSFVTQMKIALSHDLPPENWINTAYSKYKIQHAFQPLTSYTFLP